MPLANTVHIEGICCEKFQSVKQAFQQNLTQKKEVGAAVSVVYQGQRVVDLWGGYQDTNKTRLWEKDTLCCFMSTTKAIASIAVLSLVDRYGIDIDKPVAAYWPEFAESGKEGISIRCVLSNLAGLPVIDSAPPGSFFSDKIIEDGLARQPPLWKPGSTPCYHSFTYGPLCNQILLRVTGKTIGQYLREDLLLPLDLEFYVGLTDAEQERCADIIVSDGVPTLEKMSQAGTLLHRAWQPVPNLKNFFTNNEFKRHELASVNGYATARAVADIFSRLANARRVARERRLLSPALIEDVIQEQWNAVEKISDRHFRFGTGFMLNNPYFYTGPNTSSFGHPGLGGAIGFADPQADLGFAYCCNLIHPIDNTGDCATPLIDATFSSMK